MSNFHGKILYSTKVDGMKSGGSDVNVGVYGIFESSSGTGKWRYYLLSYKVDSNNNLKLTSEWHSYQLEATYEQIQKYSKTVSSIDEGRKMCDEYKLKWTTGSNDTVQEIREEKLNEILKS